MGVFNNIFTELTKTAGKDAQLMIDATDLKTHCIAAGLKKGSSRCIGRTKGGLNSKLHTICDGQGRPLAMTLTESQVGAYKGAALLINALSEAGKLSADCGYDADWFRDGLLARGPCIHPKKNRKKPICYDKICINSDIRSRSCLAGSKAGAELPCVMTAARILSFQLYASPLPSCSILINEA